MSFNTKVSTLTILLALQSILHLLNGVFVFSSGASYGAYGNSFVQAGIMGYLSYLIFSTRTKSTYWFAVFFVAIALVRFAIGGALIVSSGIAPTLGETAIILFSTLAFGIVPSILLLNRELRAAFLENTNAKDRMA